MLLVTSQNSIKLLLLFSMHLHYTDNGQSAPTLVFLHYFGGAASSWNEVIIHLQNEFRCIAIDLYGFGHSPAPTSQVTVEGSSENVRELIQYLTLTNYILIGHSMGAKIAVDVAAKSPKGLQGLILIAPSPPSPEPMKEKDRQDMCNAFGNRKAIEKMLKNALGSAIPDEVFEREVQNNLLVSETAWKSWPESGSKEDISLRMQYVNVPVHILYGEKDKRFTKKFLQREYSQYFKTFSLIEVMDAGHLVPVEAPEKAAEEIQKLINQRSAV